MNTVRNTGRSLGTACFAAILPQSLLSEALKDKAGIVSVAKKVVLPNEQSGNPRRGN